MLIARSGRTYVWMRNLFLFAVLLVVGALFRPHSEHANSKSERAGAMAILASPATSQFSRAQEPAAFEFPRDHATHKDFRTEWWYFTGHLSDSNARPFGFQLTLFRFELDRDSLESRSAWRTPRILLGHFAISDIENDSFHHFERMSRAHPSIAGVSQQPVAVWLDDWRIEFDAQTSPPSWRLRAAQQSIELDLNLTSRHAVIKQGDAGLSRKSAALGNASYYYSVPRLTAGGRLRLGAEDHHVTGQAWLDREWSTSALDREQQGWDWFAVQFEDQSSLMFYRLRKFDGGDDAHSAGTYVDSSGNATRLEASDVSIVITDYWTSAATNIRYPHGWRLEVPRLGLSVAMRPRLADQEWTGRFRYWEGAVTAVAERHGRPLDGLGYVELTGY